MPDPVLSKGEFNAACLRGSRFTGQVEGLNFVHWVPVDQPRSYPLSSPNDIYTARNERYTGIIHVLVSDKYNPAAENVKKQAEVFQKTLELREERKRIQEDFINRIASYYEDLILAEVKSRGTLDGLEYLQLERKKQAIKNEAGSLIHEVKEERLRRERVPTALVFTSEYKKYADVIGFWSVTTNQGTLTQSPSGYEKWVAEQSQLDPFATEFAKQPVNQAISAGILSGVALGFMAEAGFFTFTTELAGYKAAGSFLGQGIANGFSDVNWIGVGADALLGPGAGAMLGSGLEIRPFSEYDEMRIIGYNKSIQQFGIDAGTGYFFNKTGGLGINKFQPYLGTGGQKLFYNLNLNIWLNYTNYETAKRLNEKYEDSSR